MKMSDHSKYGHNVEIPAKIHFVDKITSISSKFETSKQLNISTTRHKLKSK
jgi:hypothetical protein